MTTNPRDLSRRVALVSGGSSGLGAATAELLRTCGATVVVGDIEPGDGDRRLDVSDEQAVDALVHDVVEEHGRLDFAANFAGVVSSAALVDVDTPSYRRQVDVNLDGVFFCTRAQLRAMTPRRAGSIVNISSKAGVNGSRSLSVYSATKHAVVGLTKSAALDAGPLGIRVNAVCPGVIRTPMTEGIAQGSEDFYDRVNAELPLGRIGEPSEIAQAVLFLLSDAASFISGITLRVDGGAAGRS